MRLQMTLQMNGNQLVWMKKIITWVLQPFPQNEFTITSQLIDVGVHQLVLQRVSMLQSGQFLNYFK